MSQFTLIALACAFLCIACAQGLTCQLFLTGATTTATSATCSAGERCGRIELTTDGTIPSLVGTRCYPATGCEVDDATCQVVARSEFGRIIAASDNITSCEAACCSNMDNCNALLLSTFSGASGLTTTTTYQFYKLCAFIFSVYIML